MSDWRIEAACRDADPELFFPTGEETADAERLREQTREARAICAACPVLVECGRWAADAGQRWGVAGGLTSADRRAVRRTRTTTTT